jgi:UDP-N-acetylglucosamine 2-epimerase
MTRASAPFIRILLGTKAQYIKTAPLLRLMDERGIPYRLVDSGQHGAHSVSLRSELGVRDPDAFIGGRVDIDSIPKAITWATRLLAQSFSRPHLAEIFGSGPGICVVHGDAPTALLGTMIARRAGLEIAQLESGVRSFNLLNPFPEEIVRILVMKRSRLLFAESQAAFRQLQGMRLAGDPILIGGNTIIDALRYSLRNSASLPPRGPAIVTLHRVEALSSNKRIEALIDVIRYATRSHTIQVVLHPPTRRAFEARGILEQLENVPEVSVTDLLPHSEFIARLAGAPFVITDGGSIQEECSLLGVPTLLWRGATERPDDLERNTVLSDYAISTAKEFIDEHQKWRHEPNLPQHSPSEQVLDTLINYVEAAR